MTRTVSLGPPQDLQKEHFTRVLRGHIDLARAIFPPKTLGVQLDVLARNPLWEIRLDYEHGTGHGVGSYLSVHEGPQSISKRPHPVPLQCGMVVSNEPKYYRINKYGIRLENLMVVVEKNPSQDKQLGFQTLTLVPFERYLIAPQLLASWHIDWLNDYHQKVYETHATHLEEEARVWLLQQTQPI